MKDEIKTRKQALEELARRLGVEGVSIQIPFRNDDVPEFLEKLYKFMEESRQRKGLYVKSRVQYQLSQEYQKAA